MDYLTPLISGSKTPSLYCLCITKTIMTPKKRKIGFKWSKEECNTHVSEDKKNTLSLTLFVN